MIFDNVYEAILEGYKVDDDEQEIKNVIDTFSDIETRQENIRFYKEVMTYKGIKVFYDFGADYYFFQDIK